MSLLYIAQRTLLVTPTELGYIRNFSTICGIISLSIWFVAQLPQIIHNHLKRSVEGISPGFLTFWISGDACCLAGCLLSEALPFQIGLAAYSCFVDTILILQYWYYTRVYPKQKHHVDLYLSIDRYSPSTTPLLKKSTQAHERANNFERSHSRNVSAATAKALAVSVLGKASAFPIIASSTLPMSDSTWLQPFLISKEYRKILGMIFGWTAASFFVSSRAFQIRMNLKTGTVEGFSPFLFILAILGDTFYNLSILSDFVFIYQTDQANGEKFFSEVFFAQLPYVASSLVTISCDMFILSQYRRVQRKSTPLSMSESCESEYTLVGRKTYGSISSPEYGNDNSNEYFKKPDWCISNNIYRTDENKQILSSSASTKVEEYRRIPPKSASYSQADQNIKPRKHKWSDSTMHMSSSDLQDTRESPVSMKNNYAIMSNNSPSSIGPLSPLDFLYHNYLDGGTSPKLKELLYSQKLPA